MKETKNLISWFENDSLNFVLSYFENISKLLKVNKSDIKKILIKHFDDNFDYTIKKIKKKQINSREATISEQILITPNCMKELCMIS